MAEVEKAPSADAPYREQPSELRYLCTVCYQLGSTTPAICPRCNAPMLALDDPEVVLMVRARIAAGVTRKRKQLGAVGLVVAFGASAVICFALGLPLIDAGLKFGQYGSYWVSIGLPLALVWWFATWRLFPAPSDSEPLAKLISRLHAEPIERSTQSDSLGRYG